MKTRTPSDDLLSERLVALADVPGLLPKRRGKKVHYQTVHRWTRKGAGGRVLESLLVGGARYTSIEALRRFMHGRLEAGSDLDAYDRMVEAQLKAAGL
jgi:hypothetical protein